jgi:flagellar basal-body rod protein FlgC
MTIFGAINTAGNGLGVYRTWMDAISDNVANVNTVRPTDQPAFQERFVVARSINEGNVPTTAGNGLIGNGAHVAGVEYGGAEGRLTYQPGNPLADANGMVRMPNIDMGDQMTSLLMAERGYQANLAVVDRAKDMYTAALQIGK